MPDALSLERPLPDMDANTGAITTSLGSTLNTPMQLYRSMQNSSVHSSTPTTPPFTIETSTPSPSLITMQGTWWDRCLLQPLQREQLVTPTPLRGARASQSCSLVTYCRCAAAPSDDSTYLLCLRRETHIPVVRELVKSEKIAHTCCACDARCTYLLCKC